MLADGNSQLTYKLVDNLPGNSQGDANVNNQSNRYVVFCEGNSQGRKNKNFDEKCYTRIFSSEFPNAVFCSIGACNDIESTRNLMYEVISKVNPYHTIIMLMDRDDRSAEEVEELKERGITVLSLRELESYLLDDEIIKKLCIICEMENRFAKVLDIKSMALQESISRNNPSDDLKSASGLFLRIQESC